MKNDLEQCGRNEILDLLEVLFLCLLGGLV